jgi:RHS repeat-associated protein
LCLDGTPVQRAVHFPLHVGDAWGNPQSAGGLTVITPWGYAGGYTDPDGLIYLINRYYDPKTGQFTSVDPEADTTLAPYAYTGGDPVNATDPTGQARVNRANQYPSCRFLNAVNWTASSIKSIMNTTEFSNIHEAMTSLLFGDPGAGLLMFAQEVRPNGPWDLKTSVSIGGGPHIVCRTQGEGGEPCFEGGHTNGKVTWQGWSRVTANRQIAVNVWANVLFGYLGIREGIDGGTLQGLPNDLAKIHLDPTFGSPGNNTERQMGIDAAKYPATGGSLEAVIIRDLGKFKQPICDLIAYPYSASNRNEKAQMSACAAGGSGEWYW